MLNEVKVLTPLHGKLSTLRFPKLRFEAYAEVIIGTNDIKVTRMLTLNYGHHEAISSSSSTTDK